MATTLGSVPNNLTLDQLKQDLFLNLRYRLGEGIIDIELDAEHFNAAYNYAIKVYRQRAQNSTQETYTLMSMILNQDVYVLPSEYVNVRAIFRRTVGLDTGPSSSSFDPFSSAILNTYLLNYNQAGGLATYDFYAGYVELAARMFGGYIMYTFNAVSKELRIVRDPKGTGERVLLWADMLKPEEHLLQDPQSGVWIGDFTYAVLKGIIGEAREKFGTIVGPGGGTTLNGAAMKSESKALQDQLIEDLKQYRDGSQPLSFIIG
jgi:hypothetical protein